MVTLNIIFSVDLKTTYLVPHKVAKFTKSNL